MSSLAPRGVADSVFPSYSVLRCMSSLAPRGVADSVFSGVLRCMSSLAPRGVADSVFSCALRCMSSLAPRGVADSVFSGVLRLHVELGVAWRCRLRVLLCTERCASLLNHVQRMLVWSPQQGGVNACDAGLIVPGFGVLKVCRTNAQPAFAGWLELGGASVGGCPVACLVQNLHGMVRA
jgi:hypothetical protein